MFSPPANVPPGTSSRNPKRRQRNSSEDSIAFRHNPKRLRRSELTKETFLAPEPPKANGHIEPAHGHPTANGHTKAPGQRDGAPDTTRLTIRDRGVSRSDRERSGSRTQEGKNLTENDNYIVTQLPTTPDQLRGLEHSEPWNGEISTKLGYALAITQEHAIIWRYSQSSTSGQYMKPLTIKLPHPSTYTRQPQPLGLLVPSSGEPSLLVVMPASGKITYWESLTAAATADPTRQKQQCIQATVSGMMSGEAITRVCEGEPHGFVLTFSSGRIAHIAISDLQGKPSIVVRFLRNDAAHTGGLFGGLRSVFSTASWRRDVAAIRPGISLYRGHKQLVVATTKSVFQIWDLNWNGTQSLIHEIDGKESLLKALAEGGDVFQDHDDHYFEILDFALKPKKLAINENSSVAHAQNKGDCQLYVLTVLHGPERSMYNLVGLTLANGSITVDVVHPISCYRSPLSKDLRFKPQITVPEPGHTAFIAFEKSIVLVSLENVPENADSQVLAEANEFPGPFQDTVEINKKKAYRTVACAAEPADTESASASCVLLIHGFGMVRILALSTPKVASARDRVRVTARTKIEQAVFFGNTSQDLLDFSGRSEIKFSHEQIETAAKEISQTILKNDYSYLPRSMPSMGDQLQRRASALADLMKHLKQRYAPLSRSTRWHLLWDAEKIAAAIAMWRTYQVAVKSHPNGKELSERNLLAEAIEICSDKLKCENQPERYETDGVRHWFINDVWRLEKLLPYIQDTVDQIQNEAADLQEEIGYADRVRLLGESVDLELAVFETVFQFREANAFLYGVDNEVMVDGVLSDGYGDLPAPWTSDIKMIARIIKQAEQIVHAVEVGQEIIDDTTPDSVVAVVNKLQTDLSRHIQVLSQVWIEEFQWLGAQSDAGEVRKAQAHRREYLYTRKKFLVKLAEFEVYEDATRLAEKYEDMEALVDIKDAERSKVLSQMQEAVGPNKDFWRGGLEELEKQIKSYFSKYGKHWSDAFFTKRLTSNETAFVLEQRSNSYQQALTAFLRRKPQYAKIGWINEVCNERDFVAAADDLQRAHDHDTNLWQKRIEVSLRKLALIAASQQTQIKEEDVKASIESSDKIAATINMQDQLRSYFEPTLKSAIDADAGADLLMETHFIGLIQEQKYLHERTRHVVQQLVTNEVLSAEDLIDVFTLMNGVVDEDGYVNENATFDNRFNLALHVLRCADLHKSQPASHSMLEKIIWRRCLIQDDWEAINRTEDKDDATVKSETAHTAYYKTLKAGFASEPPTADAPAPSDLRDAGTTIPSLRTSARYTSYPDSELDLLANDLRRETHILDEYIEKGRLMEHWEGIVADAKESVKRDTEAAMDRRQRRKERERRNKVGGEEDGDGEVVGLFW